MKSEVVFFKNMFGGYCKKVEPLVEKEKGFCPDCKKEIVCDTYSEVGDKYYIHFSCCNH